MLVVSSWCDCALFMVQVNRFRARLVRALVRDGSPETWYTIKSVNWFGAVPYMSSRARPATSLVGCLVCSCLQSVMWIKAVIPARVPGVGCVRLVPAVLGVVGSRADAVCLVMLMVIILTCG